MGTEPASTREDSHWSAGSRTPLDEGPRSRLDQGLAPEDDAGSGARWVLMRSRLALRGVESALEQELPEQPQDLGLQGRISDV